jgi:RNA polymerase sigma-70 factor, ECF subfamily
VGELDGKAEGEGKRGALNGFSHRRDADNGDGNYSYPALTGTDGAKTLTTLLLFFLRNFSSEFRIQTVTFSTPKRCHLAKRCGVARLIIEEPILEPQPSRCMPHVAGWLETVRPEAIAHCARLLNNEHDAEDAAQEGLIRVLAGYSHIKSLSEFRAVLFTILSRLCTDVARHRKAHASAVELIRLRDSQSGESDPAARLVGGELAQATANAFADLPANQRLALYLLIHERMSYEKIATAMGKSLAEVKVWIHRGRKRVQATLSGYLDDRGANNEKL